MDAIIRRARHGIVGDDVEDGEDGVVDDVVDGVVVVSFSPVVAEGETLGTGGFQNMS